MPKLMVAKIKGFTVYVLRLAQFHVSQQLVSYHQVIQGHQSR